MGAKGRRLDETSSRRCRWHMAAAGAGCLVNRAWAGAQGNSPLWVRFFSLSSTLLSLPILSEDRPLGGEGQACGPRLSLGHPWDTGARGRAG